jgi:hypothetical protein
LQVEYLCHPLAYHHNTQQEMGSTRMNSKMVCISMLNSWN